MSQVPQDPRQLARDILSGKVKIEDLARMRQARGGQPGAGGAGGGGGAARQMPQARPPQQIPLARPAQQQPVQAMPARRPAPVKQQVVRPVVRQQGRGPQIAPPRALAPARPVTAPLAPMQTEYKQAQDSPAKAPSGAPKGFGIKELLRDKRGLRQGILLAEVLGRPVGMRDG